MKIAAPFVRAKEWQPSTCASLEVTGNHDAASAGGTVQKSSQADTEMETCRDVPWNEESLSWNSTRGRILFLWKKKIYVCLSSCLAGCMCMGEIQKDTQLFKLLPVWTGDVERCRISLQGLP